jgi:serine/threonine-protein kinase
MEKGTYMKFADALVGRISYFNNKYEPINDIDIILNKLGTLIRSSSLETFIQDNSQLIKCFIKGSFAYNKRCEIEVQHVKNFYQLLVRLDQYKQKIVLDNIQTRLGSIKVNINIDDLPF